MLSNKELGREHILLFTFKMHHVSDKKRYMHTNSSFRRTWGEMAEEEGIDFINPDNVHKCKLHNFIFRKQKQ
jgi:hypothetical protein